MRPLTLAILLLVLIGAQAATATSTVCRNPARARVLSTGTVSLPSSNIGALQKRFEAVAVPLGMTTWGVASYPDGKTLRSKTLGLQSPKASVSISAEWKPRQRFAKIVVERTCYSDDLEPWQPYWRGLLARLREAGYKIT